jgi:hypothetical protein
MGKEVFSEYEDTEDPLSAFRGCLVAMLFMVAAWAAVGLVILATVIL